MTCTTVPVQTTNAPLDALDIGGAHYFIAGTAPHWHVNVQMEGCGSFLVLSPPAPLKAEIERRKAEYAKCLH